MNRFRILSLDGGGIKGAFTAAVLAALEEVTGRERSSTILTCSPGHRPGASSPSVWEWA